MSDARGADYRTSAAPAELGSTCLLCGADGEAGKSCVTCGVAMPSITCTCGAVNGVAAARCARCSASVADTTPRPRACPRCTTPLIEVGIEAGAGASVHVCDGCHGLFVPARAWHLLIARQDLVGKLAQRLPAKREAPADLRLLGCPDCASEMERMRFAAISSVVIDACPHQHGMWLDAGELAGATGYAQHRRAIGADAAIAEAERLQYQLAHEQALAQVAERRRLAVTIAQPRAARSLLEHRRLILMCIACFAVYYAATGSCRPRSRGGHGPTRDNAQQSTQELGKSP